MRLYVVQRRELMAFTGCRSSRWIISSGKMRKNNFFVKILLAFGEEL